MKLTEQEAREGLKKYGDDETRHLWFECSGYLQGISGEEMKAKEAEIEEHKKRADDNFASCMRIRDKFSAECNRVKALVGALKDARKYLEERGIRIRGTIGRTILLPKIDSVLAAYDKEGKS